MKKYYVGLMALGLLSLIVSIYVVTLGIQSRQDVQTEKVAQEAANKLNAYVSKKQKIPASLAEAGVSDVPSTISYKVISSSSYRFCVTYKAAKGYGSGDITTAVTGAALSRAYGSGSMSSDSSYESSELSSLYLSYTHKKGEDCQTVKPYLYSSYDRYDNSDSSSSSSTDYCDPSNKYYEQYKEYCPTTTTKTPKTKLQ